MAYANERRDGPPIFDDLDTRLAYAVAYHPAHAYAYLHLLLRRDLGDVIFKGLSHPIKVLVLGAGPGAETLAVIRWMEASAPHLLGKAQFSMVDRADWTETRRSVLGPTVRESFNRHKIVFDQKAIDLSTKDGEELLSKEAPHANVILCPSVFSEMLSEGSGNFLLGSLCSLISESARLAVIDHHHEFKDISRQWSGRLEVLSEGEAKGGVVLPHPSGWVKENLLDWSNNRKPVLRYPLAWAVLVRGR